MYKFITLILLATVLITATEDINAQRDLRKFEMEKLSVDTATDAETLYFNYDAYATDRYNMAWQFSAANLTGTTAGTATLQVTLDKEGDADAVWTDYDSFTFSAADDTVFVINDFPYARARLQLVTTGTQSSEINNWVKWIRRKD